MQNLASTGITDLAQEGNTFTGSVTNPWEEEAMLCVPLLYNSHWTALVDGVETDLQNINGGLLGIRLPAGEHTITLTYRDSAHLVGTAISAAALSLYLIGAIVWLRRSCKR
jgi:uncharacterized membrane protein YfhO